MKGINWPIVAPIVFVGFAFCSALGAVAGAVAYDYLKYKSDLEQKHKEALASPPDSIYSGPVVEIPKLGMCISEQAKLLHELSLETLETANIHTIRIVRGNMRYDQCDSIYRDVCGWKYDYKIQALDAENSVVSEVEFDHTQSPLSNNQRLAAAPVKFGLSMMLNSGKVRLFMPESAIDPKASLDGTCLSYLHTVLLPAANALLWQPAVSHAAGEGGDKQ